jgi:hypothetical protein
MCGEAVTLPATNCGVRWSHRRLAPSPKMGLPSPSPEPHAQWRDPPDVELPGASQCGGPSSLAGTHEQAVHFTEIYRFDVGYQDILRWTIRKLGRGVYRGAEARSVGEAVGEQAGCAFEMIDLSALRPYPKMRDAILARDKAHREELRLSASPTQSWASRIGDPCGSRAHPGGPADRYEAGSDRSSIGPQPCGEKGLCPGG